MKTPQIPANENERQKDLESYSILDTLPEIDYDNLSAIAAEICGTSISLISLIDNNRQWFKSHHGYNEKETPRNHAFCAHAINDPHEIFVIQDARNDERFHDNPLVTGEPYIIFYAGVPLISESGQALGTLCVIDQKAKQLNESQLRSLKALSNQVMNLLELRKTKKSLEESHENLEDKNQELERFAYVAAHDIKSPLIGISSMTQLFTEEYSSIIDEEGQSMLSLIEDSSDKLRRMIDGLLEYSCCEKVLIENRSSINPEKLKNELTGLFSYEKKLIIILNSAVTEVLTNKTALDQILINLMANAVKYNDKEITEIKLGISETDKYYEFFIQDNGPGIAKKNQEKIFKVFEVLSASDKYGRSGNGIGLATVKKLVEKLGGDIKVESKLGEGSKFTFTIEK